MNDTGKQRSSYKEFPGCIGIALSDPVVKTETVTYPDSAGEAAVGLRLPEVLFKTIHHFAPDFLGALSRIPDPRDPRITVYPIEEMFLVGILLFVLKARSRRNIKFRLGTPKFIENLLRIAEVFYPKRRFLFPDDVLLHGDTLNKLLKRIPAECSHKLRILLVRALIRSRCLEKWRILGCYAITIDGTGMIVYYQRHCPHCLTRKPASGRTQYYHPVLEAKLVCPGLGLAISIGTEFIENPGEMKNEKDKQDCELKAFHRLLPKLRKDFPQMPMCLLLDALYANERVFKLSEDLQFAHLITFKEGSLPATWKEYQALKGLTAHQKQQDKKGDQTSEFCWVNQIDYNGHTLNALEMTQMQGGAQTFYSAWLSSWFITQDNVKALGLGGRGRWIIENEGFNSQKNGGYEMEHAFSTDNVAMKHFYYLLQIGHAISQLMEKGSLLREKIKQTMGSLRVFSERLWALMTETLIEAGSLRAFLAQRIQIRFDTS